MKPIINKKIREIVDKQGFTMGEIIANRGEFNIELNRRTPAGEDWYETIWFDGTSKGFIQGVEELYAYFDVDDAVEPYIETRGTYGVPNSIAELLKDAEWKAERLENLTIALNAA